MAIEIDLDDINENDMLNALSDINQSSTSNIIEEDIEPKDNINIEEEPQNTNISTTIDNINSADIASLINLLLNNKTLEITIKVKDN